MTDLAARGEEVVCISAPTYVRGIAITRRYIVNDVKVEGNGASYYHILGDDDRGHWLAPTLFTALKKFEPIDATGWAEVAFDPPAQREASGTLREALTPIWARAAANAARREDNK